MRFQSLASRCQTSIFWLRRLRFATSTQLESGAATAQQKSERLTEVELNERYKPNQKFPQQSNTCLGENDSSLLYHPRLSEQLSLHKGVLYQHNTKLLFSSSETNIFNQFSALLTFGIGGPLLLGIPLYWADFSDEYPYFTIAVGSALAVYSLTFLWGARSMWQRLQIRKPPHVCKLSLIDHLEKGSVLEVMVRQMGIISMKEMIKYVPLSSTDAEHNRIIQLSPHIDEESLLPSVKCVINVPMDTSEVVPFVIPLNGMVSNWESFLTFMAAIPNPAGKFTPVKVTSDGYVPVIKYKELLKMPRATLEVFLHGVPPYARKYSYLLVTNQKRDKAFVLYDKCKSNNASLVSEATYYEDGNDSYLHCDKCITARNRSTPPLKSCVSWKLSDVSEGRDVSTFDDIPDTTAVDLQEFNRPLRRISQFDGQLREETIGGENDNTDDNDAMVMIKLDPGSLLNRPPETNINGECSLDRLVHFHCANSLRLTFPKAPQSIEDLWVLGRFTQLNDWDSDNPNAVQFNKLNH